jgi:hypothetical protein
MAIDITDPSNTFKPRKILGHLDFFAEKARKLEFDRKQATRIQGFTDLSQFESLAKSTPSSRINSVQFGGGFLSPENASRAQFLQKEALVTDFETKQTEANAANEARFQGILAEFGTTIDAATARGPETLQFNEAQFAGLGDQAKKDIFQNFTNLEAANTQNLVSSGLAGTTARGAVTSNVARGQAQALGTLNEQLRRERIGQSSEIDRFNASTRNAYAQYLDSLSIQKLSFQERKEEEGPDQALFLQQLEKFGNV